MLGDLDLKRIRNELSGLDIPLELIFHPDPDGSPLSDELEKTARQIEQAAQGSVVVKEGDGADMPALPALSLSYRGKSNIHYLAVPEGPEVLPFLEACTRLPLGAAGHTGEWVRKLSGLKQPAELFVFMATTCPNCPHAVRTAITLSQISYPITTFVIDAQRFETLAGSLHVRSVPTTILDGGWTRVGVIPPEELVERILGREDAKFSDEVFQSMVETGRVDDATEILCKHGPAPLVAAWRVSSTSSRMGLLLVVEGVLEKDDHALDELVPDLLPMAKSEDAAMRGDTADLLGQIGHPAAIDTLESLLEDENPDVAEIAGEAIEEIKGRE